MTYAITVPGDRCWITDPLNPGGGQVVCGTRQSSPVVSTVEGTVNVFAGGRVQGSVRVAQTFSAAYTLAHLSPTDVAQLEAWRGQIVLVRTIDGERFFAVYFDTSYQRVLRTVPDDDDTGTVTYDMPVSFYRVSVNESAL